MKKTIKIFTTGGTIDKSFSEQKGQVINATTTINQFLLPHLRLPFTQIEITEIMAKDSLQMTDTHRDQIYQYIKKEFLRKNPILVLHGTDTLDQTLKWCFHKNPSPPVCVIFTGAMRPSGFAQNDALQNFTEALYAAHLAPPGFYVSFHGQLLKGPHIKKDKNLGTFVST